jgi:hypothetical protein
MSHTRQIEAPEYAPEPVAPANHHCMTCGQPIVGQYFRIESSMTCPACAEKRGGRLPTSPKGAFTRGLLFAAGGALVGLILYSAVGIITGLEIGYVSIAVGYIVARAMLAGTAGVGGRRHQVAAALLTYVAVSMSAVPISLWQFTHEKSVASAAVEESVLDPEGLDTEEAGPPQTLSGTRGLFGAFVFLSMMGLMSPFLGLAEPMSGFIGLVILFVGIRIAWAMTAGNGVEVSGPYHC